MSSFRFCQQKWQPQPTVKGGDSFFHAAFGKYDDKLQAYFDPLASVRRMQWFAFLTYFENNAKPTCLKNQLRECLRKSDADSVGDYTENVMRSECQIHVKELPILATLLNIRIVVFIYTAPDVFEPDSGLLGDYPVENIKSLVEVVVSLKESDYVRLQAEPTGIRMRLSGQLLEPSITQSTYTYERIKAKRFLKHTGSTGIGRMLYHINLLAILMTNGINKFPHWRLPTKKEGAGYFDDVVFQLLPSEEAILVQTRYEMTEKVISHNLLDNTFWGLPRLYFSYQKIKRDYNIRNVIVCINVDLALEVKFGEMFKQMRLREDSIFHYEGVESPCYTFNSKFISYLIRNLKESTWRDEDVISEENVEEFIKHLQIIAPYPSKGNFDKVIASIILSLGYSDQFDSEDYSHYLNKKITDWVDERNGIHLTDVDAKALLCGYRSKKFCGKLHDTKINFKDERLTFDSAKRMLHIVPHREYTLNLIKVYRFLQEKGVKSLFVNTGDPVNVQRQTTEAFEVSKCTYLVICIDTKNEAVIGEMCDKLTNTLNTYTWKTVIMIAGKDNICAKRMATRNEDLYEQLEDTISFTNLTEQSQERLLEEVIMIFEAHL